MSNQLGHHYTHKSTLLTLREGLETYYAENPNITDPRQQPPKFAKILLAHDVSHVVYGCDTGMYDELKLLPLIWWTSNYRFRDHLQTLQDPMIAPAIRVMYDDLVKKNGKIWLYSSIFFTLPLLLPELILIWLKACNHKPLFPFLEFEPLLDRSLQEIRQEFKLIHFIKNQKL
jgi:ubiquinone biosynthesis protein Coq4